VTPHPPPTPARRRKDESMDLLNEILRNPIEPEYAVVAARGSTAGVRRGAMLAVALVIGAMFAMSVIQTTRSAPAVQQEREQLIASINNEEQRQDALLSRIETLRTDIEQARTAVLSGDGDARATQEALQRLGPPTGAVPVLGPGIVIVVDDSPVTRDDQLNRVLDRDLQYLVNGLWEAGAEAIAINGHRLSVLTAIRSAGDAITVDYRSLTRPYRVEVIGDPRTLAARFANTSGGQLWQGLQENYGMRLSLSQAEELSLRADPGLALRHARRME
jgi:uncharacterized protein YlxW (UPF0749 family)